MAGSNYTHSYSAAPLVIYSRTVSSFLFPLVFTFLFSLGCTAEYLPKEELVEFIADEDNGLSISHDVNGFQLKVSYHPTDLLVLQETGEKSIPPGGALESIRDKYKDYHYFILSISKGRKEALYSGQESQGQFSELIQTLSYRMGNHVNLTTSRQDTVFLADYIYQRTYGMSEATNLLFVFSEEEIKEPEWIQFNLKEFGLGLGNQNFRFNMRDLRQAPKLNFNQPTK
jgi:hypothetical protein